MKAIDYFKTKERMTRNCEIECSSCPLGKANTKTILSCSKFQHNYPEKAVEIVRKWGEDNPVKTYLADFLEKLPHARIRDYNGRRMPQVCRKEVYEDFLCKFNCYDCWNEKMSDNVES